MVETAAGFRRVAVTAVVLHFRRVTATAQFVVRVPRQWLVGVLRPRRVMAIAATLFLVAVHATQAKRLHMVRVIERHNRTLHVFLHREDRFLGRFDMGVVGAHHVVHARLIRLSLRVRYTLSMAVDAPVLVTPFTMT